jgi:hypothetical protein
MDVVNNGWRVRLIGLVTILILGLPLVSLAEDYKVFKSEEYGFSMKYPSSWVKIDKPKGNYYVVFQAPDLTDNFRNRIHVAAHDPVKDPLKVFLQELRNGIKDLQQKSAKGGPDAQQVRIIDEGEFKSEVPGAYYFFIQAFENKLNIWMDIVIVFFKHDQTLLRVSCLAPSTIMEKMQPVFNDILVSLAFSEQEPSAAQPPRPSSSVRPGPDPAQEEQEPVAPPAALSKPPQPRLGPPPSVGGGPAAVQPQTPPSYGPAEQPEREIQRSPAPAPAARPAPRGPARGPERPQTGIVD